MISYRMEIDFSSVPNAAKMEKQADDVIGASMTEMGLIFQRAVQVETPLGATKLLRGSVFSEPRGVPVREVIVGSTQLYAAPVERGRQPGKMPPVDPIALWVKRKLGAGSDKQAKQIAFAIARKIARVGTTGAAMFFKGFTAGRPAAERLANGIGAKIVAEWER